MRGSKTTAISHVRVIVKLLKKKNIVNISYGVIVPVRHRRDNIPTIKLKLESGAKLITVTSKLYKQEFRIYDNVPQKIIKDILKKNLSKTFRILQ